MPARRRDLRVLAGAVFLSAVGDMMATITLALAVHEVSGSGLAVSAFFASTMLPVIALARPGGLLADRVDAVRVIGVASLAQAAVAVGLAYATGDLAAILILSALLAAGSALSAPAEFALVPLLVRDSDLTRANGVMEATRYAGFAAGPFVAALLAVVGGPREAMLVSAATFAAIAACMPLIHARREPPAAGVAEPTRGRGGLGYLMRDEVLRPTVLAVSGGLLFISACLTIEVFYVKDTLGAGDAGYAALVVPWMLGMVVGATRLAPRVPDHALAAVALAALAVQGAGVAGQTVWAVLPSALVGYGLGGVAHGVKNTLMRTLIQRRVPGAAHGRAFAAYNAVRNTCELGALGAGGVLVGAVGPRLGLVIAGVGPVIAGLGGLAALHQRATRDGEHVSVAPSAASP